MISKSKADTVRWLANQPPQEDLREVQSQVLAAMEDQDAGRMTLVDDKGTKVELERTNGLWKPVEEPAPR